jgi:hypothetical protein
MSVVRWEDDLPKQVQKHLRDVKDVDERLQLAVRTSFRVNPDLPYAWLIPTTNRNLLCSTHHSRGVHADLRYSEISSIRLFGQCEGVEILPKSLEVDDLSIPLPEITGEVIQEILQVAKPAIGS